MAAANTSLPDPYYHSPELIDTLIPPGRIPTGETQSNTIICNERRIRIGESRKRKRTEAEDKGYDCSCEDQTTYTADATNHSLCWNAFQPYLEKCIPVKIKNVASFRHVTDGTSNEPVFSTMNVDSLPSEVLDKSITVQCVPRIDCESLQSTELEDNTICQNARDIDAKLSILSNSASEEMRSVPTFMGQEDQVTTCMSLRELLSINKHSHHVSASQLPVLDVDEMEQDSISLSVDGKLNQLTTNLELSPLASVLRLPSYLLLGNPHNKSNDIVIHSINLWHAPQPCCTNVHYDEHDNLLIVTNGVKIVELCPPGCIQASGVYSAHANHPKLLRRCGNMPIEQEIQTTLKKKNGRTQIVTVAAGEALYIPLGWWHRVISKCDQNDAIREARSSGCTAINVWFDHPSRQSNLPEHMAVFQLRQSSRRYFLLNKEYATKSLLEEKKREYFFKNEMPQYFSEQVSNTDEVTRHWKDMNLIVFVKEELDKTSILSFGMIYCRCLSMRLCTPHLYHDLLEGFLLRIELGNASHIAGLVNMWSDVGQETMRFSEILCKLSPEACYILTQAWERHAGINTFVDESGHTQDEAETSYQRFFLILGDHSNKVRNHLLNGVEDFYHQAWVMLSSEI
eukprot:scaffold4742_cov149-Skeletonema_menzelii.AAC.9